MSDLAMVWGVPIERVPEPLRSALEATFTGLPLSPFAWAMAQATEEWIIRHYRRYGHRPSERCTDTCR